MGARRQNQANAPDSRYHNSLIRKKNIKNILNSQKISNNTEQHIHEVKRVLHDFAESVDWEVDFDKVTDYLESKKDYSHGRYRFHVLYVRKLLKEIGADFAKNIDLPSVPETKTPRITSEKVQKFLQQFSELGIEKPYYQRLFSGHLLGAVSGMRATEIYRLTWDDINFEGKQIRLKVGETVNSKKRTKNQKERIVFFNQEAKKALKKYYEFSKDESEPFRKTKFAYWYEKFRDELNLRMRQMRKFFSQEWRRRGGDPIAKKKLLGHSTKKDIDAQHYDSWSEEELREEYEEVNMKIFN